MLRPEHRLTPKRPQSSVPEAEALGEMRRSVRINRNDVTQGGARPIPIKPLRRPTRNPSSLSKFSEGHFGQRNPHPSGYEMRPVNPQFRRSDSGEPARRNAQPNSA